MPRLVPQRPSIRDSRPLGVHHHLSFQSNQAHDHFFVSLVLPLLAASLGSGSSSTFRLRDRMMRPRRLATPWQGVSRRPELHPASVYVPSGYRSPKNRRLGRSFLIHLSTLSSSTLVWLVPRGTLPRSLAPRTLLQVQPELTAELALATGKLRGCSGTVNSPFTTLYR